MGGLSTDIRTGLAFCTRLPLAHDASASGADVAQASWTFPIIGALVGALGALVYWLANAVELHPFVSSVLAIAATVLATGCLHEDALADTVDGFGGGDTKERKLEIMRDSRIGTYGATVLILSLMVKAGALASLGDPVVVAAALIAAHAGARAAMPLFMLIVPQARRNGLSASAGKPPTASWVVASTLGVVALIVGLGVFGASIAVLLVAAAIGIMARLTVRQIGGQTGDVLGAVEQVNEILILLTAAVRF
jgi:adenosylcobinamide-GDP ribazoletransferase